MTLGPGKYDDLCSHVRETSNASAVVLIIVDGDKGSGFSMQVIAEQQLGMLKGLPGLLRDMAEQIETDIARASEVDT